MRTIFMKQIVVMSAILALISFQDGLCADGYTDNTALDKLDKTMSGADFQALFNEYCKDFNSPAGSCVIGVDDLDHLNTPPAQQASNAGPIESIKRSERIKLRIASSSSSPIEEYKEDNDESYIDEGNDEDSDDGEYGISRKCGNMRRNFPNQKHNFIGTPAIRKINREAACRSRGKKKQEETKLQQRVQDLQVCNDTLQQEVKIRIVQLNVFKFFLESPENSMKNQGYCNFKKASLEKRNEWCKKLGIKEESVQDILEGDIVPLPLDLSFR